MQHVRKSMCRQASDDAGSPRPRRICLALDRANILRWHLWLIDELRKRHDVAVALVAREDAFRIPLACRLAFEIERLIYRIPPGAAIDRIDASAISTAQFCNSNVSDSFDVVIDFAGAAGRAAKGQRILTVLFNGAPTEIGMLAALFDNRSLCIAVEDSERPGECAQALPALADRKVMTHVFDNACSIAVDLVAKALESQPSQVAGRYSASPPPARRRWSAAALAYLASSIAWKANRLLSLQLAGHEQWSVGYRKMSGGSLIDGRKAEFAILPDDGRRYFADPFLLRHRGRTLLFMEEFPFETARGRIAVATIDDDGAVTSPRPVIEEAHHLSYPNAFMYKGDVWMVPESGANASVDLYRAVDFPFRWRREATLVEGVTAYDSTFLRNEAGWWMFAATRERRANGWDSLSIFHAPDLHGPWRPCAQNPVVLDARAARPAGAVIHGGGAPVRPVQNCKAFYGAAISLWRIDKLSCDDFEQTEVAKIVAGQFGIHTYNSTPNFEVVDLFGRTRGVRTATVSNEPFRLSGCGANPIDGDHARPAGEQSPTLSV